MPISWSEHSATSFGGTELMARRLEDSLPPELLEKVQIFPSRVTELDATRPRILWLHDLTVDASHVLRNKGWEKFQMLVFVSYWQRDLFIRQFDIPYSKCIVIPNAIKTFQEEIVKPTDAVNLIYHTTPHRGLNLLLPVVDNLAKKYPMLHLDVYSSFNAYGSFGAGRDAQYKVLFDQIETHPQMTYHGFQPNDVVREALKKAHIFSYPNTWLETSCMALMEAMSAECICVHPSFGALPETSGKYTMMYEYTEDERAHMARFHQVLDIAIESVLEGSEIMDYRRKAARGFIDVNNNWDMVQNYWVGLLEKVSQMPFDIPKEKPKFTYVL